MASSHDLEDAPALDKKLKHDIEVVVETRVATGPDLAGRLAEALSRRRSAWPMVSPSPSLPTRLEADGQPEADDLLGRSSPIRSPALTIPEIEPAALSIEQPLARACPWSATALGTEQKIDPNLIVPDASLSLRDGAVFPWAKTSAPYYLQTLQAVAKHFGAATGTAWDEPAFEVQHAGLDGTGKAAINFVYDDGLAIRN